MDGHMIGTEP